MIDHTGPVFLWDFISIRVFTKKAIMEKSNHKEKLSRRKSFMAKSYLEDLPRGVLFPDDFLSGSSLLFV